MPSSKKTKTPTKMKILDQKKNDVLDFWNALSVIFLDYKKKKLLRVFLVFLTKERPILNDLFVSFFLTTQLSIKACPNAWLPKTLTSVQLQPIIAELCPAMVTYSPSNHSPQYKNIKLVLFLVLSKLIRKLVLLWAGTTKFPVFPFLKLKEIKEAFEIFTILY